AEPVDFRTLPFVRFEANEAHDQLDGVSLGSQVGGYAEVVPGDPLVLRDTRIWAAHWAFTPFTRYAADKLDIADCGAGLFLPPYDAGLRPGGPGEGWRDAPDWGRIPLRRTLFPIHLPTSIRSPLGGPFDLMEFIGDGLPPTTVITHVRRSDGALVV